MLRVQTELRRRHRWRGRFQRPPERTQLIMALVAGVTTLGCADAHPTESEATNPTDTLVDFLVTSASDVVNGDVSSVQALRARPGADGISLREALMAVNRESGPPTITFGGEALQRRIELTSQLPTITRDGVSIEGSYRGDRDPAVTLVGPPEGYVFLVYASGFTLRRIRIIRHRQGDAVRVRAGTTADHPLSRPDVTDIQVSDNVFDNAGITNASMAAIVLELLPGSNDGVITNVVVSNNRFLHYPSTAMDIGASGQGGAVENVVIEANEFLDTYFPVEVGAGAGNRLTAVTIRGNTFKQSGQTITVWASGLGTSQPTVVERTTIEENVFDTSTKPAIHLQAGLDGARGNIIADTKILNNLFLRSQTCAICVEAGAGDARENAIEGLLVANNTLVSPTTAVQVLANVDAVSNTLSNVTFVNTIFAGVGGIWGDLDKIQVRFSIVVNPEFAGVNGNFMADPGFVDPDADYRLQSLSPAIDAGDPAFCPDNDLIGVRRPVDGNKDGVTRCDIGAYEFVPS
jgi:hypothetical protein